MRSFWLGLLFLVLSCGEGAAAPPKRPASESAIAPALARPAGNTYGNAPPSPVLSVGLPEAAARPPEILLPAQAGLLEGADRLARLFATFAALDDGHAQDDLRILQYGDSHTASDLGVGLFRRVLQARFGDGGRGFVPLGTPWKWYGQDGVRGGMTREFEPVRPKMATGATNPKDDPFGLLGVAIEASRPGGRAWADVTARTARIEFSFLQQPGGGSFDVVVDGSIAGRVATKADQIGCGFFVVETAEGAHSVEARSAGDGPIRVFGVTLDRPQVGAVVDTLGINGAQIFTLLRWNEERFAEQLRHVAPDLVILAYGTNEALDAGLVDAEYEPKLLELLGRVARAAPSASCLLLGPPDLARHTKGQEDWKTWPRLLEVIAVQRRVARAAGCAFYDQFAAMGGPGSIAAWAVEPVPRARRDRVHLSPSGYAQLGTSFATGLIRAYDEWRAATGLPPTLASKAWGVDTR